MSEPGYYRNFCMKAPRPTLVRVFTGEETHDLVTTEDQNWARLGETIAALEPDRLELYGPSDELLRAEKRKVPKTGIVTPAALAMDPETARLTHFANLLHRAYEHTTEVAFARLVDIMTMQTERQVATERRLERVERQYFDALKENAELTASQEPESDVLTDMATAFMGGGLKEKV